MVDFPQPDSPTRPRVSPVVTVKLTPETACTVWRPLRNSTTRSSTVEDHVVAGLRVGAVGGHVGPVRALGRRWPGRRVRVGRRRPGHRRRVPSVAALVGRRRTRHRVGPGATGTVGAVDTPLTRGNQQAKRWSGEPAVRSGGSLSRHLSWA